MRIHSLKSALVALTLLALAAGGQPAFAAKDEAVAADPVLSQIGLDLERARSLAPGQPDAGLESIHSALRTRLDERLEDAHKVAAHVLEGRLYEARGNHEVAADRFDAARDEDDRGPYADDAALLRALALERQGLDAEADKAWKKWVEKYGESPLRSEADLARAWNALRRGDTALAGSVLEEAGSSSDWTIDDPRFRLARATYSFVRGEIDAALAELGPNPNTAPAVYLQALCQLESGKQLEAAASFQDVIRRDPDSRLADHARLAKANIFLQSKSYRSSAEEFDATIRDSKDDSVVAEAELRRAASVYFDGDVAAAIAQLESLVESRAGSNVAARGQFLLGEIRFGQGEFEAAIVEFNRVLTSYFQHSIAASAQYRVGRALDALGRHGDATSAYQAVVTGYPLEPEAPAAAYLAGVGLMAEEQYLTAAPFFQIVLDRYTASDDGDGTVVFARPEHQELAEASLCLLELAYHRAGDLGRLSGAPHMLLQRMPKSNSPWRAWALVIDADALAAQGRHDEAQASLEALFEQFPAHPSLASAVQLLAWSYAEQGKVDLALETERRLLTEFASRADAEQRATATLHAAHVAFNQRDYESAASGYESVLADAAASAHRSLALFQAGVCYQRLGRDGDAVDRWETLVTEMPSAEISEKAWTRAGDLYFNAGHYPEAKRCYQGLLTHFERSEVAARGMLRIAQCDFNAGDDAAAIEAFSAVIDQHPATPQATQAEESLQTSLYRLGRSAEGTQVLAELVERYPDSAFAADAQFGIAQRLFDEGSFAQAAEEFRRVVRRFPGYGAADRAQYLVGDALLQAGDEDQSRQAFEQFLTFFPDSDLRRSAEFQLGNLYFQQGDYLRTAIQYTSVLKSPEGDEIAQAALFNLALCERQLARNDEAVAHLLQYRERFGHDERALDVAVLLGEIHAEAGRIPETVEEFERALTLPGAKARRAEFWVRIGEAHEAGTDEPSAIAAYEKARSTKPRADAFRLTAVARIAQYHDLREDYASALSAYRDLAKYTSDPELAAAANERAEQLEPFAR